MIDDVMQPCNFKFLAPICWAQYLKCGWRYTL